MFGETSDYGAIDLLGVLGVNALGSHMACQNPSLRFGPKDKTGDVPAYFDVRFIAGTMAAIVAQFSGEYTTVRRVAHDLATGSLGSYVATETCRRAALQRIEAAQKGDVETTARQITQEQLDAQRAAAAPRGKTKVKGVDDETGYDW